LLIFVEGHVAFLLFRQEKMDRAPRPAYRFRGVS
jgi:hypothetical protein